MCGRISLSSADHRAAAELLAAAVPGFEAAGLSAWLERSQYRPRYNLGPGQQHYVVRARDARPILDRAQWGFEHAGSGRSKLVINARAETLAERPMFRASFRHHRALIPADGFFEWAREGDRKQPHWFHRPDRRALLLAALIQPASSTSPARFCVVTRPADEAMRWIHHRMPVILEPEQVCDWLLAEPGQAGALTHGPGPRLDSLRVDPAFNSTQHDEKICRR